METQIPDGIFDDGNPKETEKPDAKKEEKTVVPREKPKPLQASRTGELVGMTLEDQYRLAQYYVRGKMIPAHYETPEQVLTGMQFARELGLKPLTALKNIAVINGTPSLWGDLPLALVRGSGFLEDIDEYFLNEKLERIEIKNLRDDVFAAVCRVKRKGDSRARDFTWTKDDTNRAKLSGKGVWVQYKPIMMKRKARALALKDVFPDVIAGVAIAEYDYNVMPEGASSMKVEMNRDKEEVQSLNERFKNAKEV